MHAGVLVGTAHDPHELLRQEEEGASPAATHGKAEPRWKALRSRMNDPAHNPVLQRNIKAKAKLAEVAMRRQALEANTEAAAQRCVPLLRRLSVVVVGC